MLMRPDRVKTTLTGIVTIFVIIIFLNPDDFDNFWCTDLSINLK